MAFFILFLLSSCQSLENIKSYFYYKIKEKLKTEETWNKSLDIEQIYPKEREEIVLPQPKLKGDASLEEILGRRRSVREFSSKELDLEEISQLLWAAQGITQKATGFRTAPSAGALYPIEIFLAKKDGVFHYVPEEHKIVRLASTDIRESLSRACLFQSSVSDAPVDIVITAIYERTTIKYGERGIRYVHLEAGHVCQNILLQATALGLGAVPVGAFDDNEIRKIIKLPEEFAPLYVVPVGYPEE
ncbi:MAG: SagB/ThcOx family dehydrogenase [Actinobacteria bacterium]|nr:SagB/ThcOx family dehydrogenase [Actinomycetota bacterium]